mmetsp:Transcript_106839/g.302138  ORF Transcript_106839/g.302138 Transcript_106839/m.302138 type:complete len:299 (+) Transcript_106839:76-972(+)
MVTGGRPAEVPLRAPRGLRLRHRPAQHGPGGRDPGLRPQPHGGPGRGPRARLHGREPGAGAQQLAGLGPVLARRHVGPLQRGLRRGRDDPRGQVRKRAPGGVPEERFCRATGYQEVQGVQWLPVARWAVGGLQLGVRSRRGDPAGAVHEQPNPGLLQGPFHGTIRHQGLHERGQLPVGGARMGQLQQRLRVGRAAPERHVRERRLQILQGARRSADADAALQKLRRLRVDHEQVVALLGVVRGRASQQDRGVHQRQVGRVLRARRQAAPQRGALPRRLGLQVGGEQLDQLHEPVRDRQ